MTDILLSNETMQYINMAGKITKADILDCVITDDKLIFIVHRVQKLGLTWENILIYMKILRILTINTIQI